MRLGDFKALTFDVYGTLIDWETGMINGLRPLTDQLAVKPDRDTILEAHAFYESTAQRYTPGACYRDILALVYRRLAEQWGLAASDSDSARDAVSDAACAAYGQSVKDWPAFPDSAPALRYLKDHYKLVVLSNVDRASFAHSLRKLDHVFDATYLAGDIGSYKPERRNFDYMFDHLARHAIAPSDILHVAESMFHDHGPANQYGLANCRIYRRHAQSGFGATMHPGQMPSCELSFHSMADLVAAHRAQRGG